MIHRRIQESLSRHRSRLKKTQKTVSFFLCAANLILVQTAFPL